MIDEQKQRGAFWQGKDLFGAPALVRIHPFDRSVEVYAHDSYGGQSVYLDRQSAVAVAKAILEAVPDTLKN